MLFFFALCWSSAERRSLALRKGNRAAHSKQTKKERERTEGRGPAARRTSLRRDSENLNVEQRH
jgi:hypothetical protein